MIKAIFFDLDGTLLDSRKQVLPSSIDAIKKCREKGIKIFISTARSPMLDKMLGWDSHILSLFDGGVYCNGAIIKTGLVTRYNYIQPYTIKKCCRAADRYTDVHYALHLTDDGHALNHRLPDDMLMPWGLAREDILPLDENSMACAVKMIIYYSYLVDSDRALPYELYEEIRDNFSDSINVYLQDKGKTIQLAAKGITKFSSILEVCKEYGFEKDEVAVFGDDVNDMEMLTGFPNSITMGNAEDTVKQAAAYTTLSNDDGGIAYAIEHILQKATAQYKP